MKEEKNKKPPLMKTKDRKKWDDGNDRKIISFL